MDLTYYFVMAFVGEVLDEAWKALMSFFELGGFSQVDLISIFILLVVGIVGGKVVSELLTRLMKMSGVDELAVKVDIQKFLRKVGFSGSFSEFFGGLLKYFIYLIVFLGIFNILGIEAFMRYLQAILGYIPNMVLAFVVFFVGFVFFSHIEELIIGFYRQKGLLSIIDDVEPTTPSYVVLARFIRIFGVSAVFIIVLAILGVDTIIVYMMTAALLIGFVSMFIVGFRDILRNLGISIYMQHSGTFLAGKKVSVDGMKGKIVHVTPLYTKIKHGEGFVYIPNSELLGKDVEYEE